MYFLWKKCGKIIVFGSQLSSFRFLKSRGKIVQEEKCCLNLIMPVLDNGVYLQLERLVNLSIKCMVESPSFFDYIKGGLHHWTRFWCFFLTPNRSGQLTKMNTVLYKSVYLAIYKIVSGVICVYTTFSRGFRFLGWINPYILTGITHFRPNYG